MAILLSGLWLKLIVSRYISGEWQKIAYIRDIAVREKYMENLAVEAGSKVLRAIGNAKRLQILFVLRKEEKNVGELEAVIGLSQSALSQHLAVLRNAKVVKTRRQAQTIYYSIKNAVVLNVLSILDRYYNQHYE